MTFFNRKTDITIAEILRGVEPGRMQSVGVMQVIPLLSELEDKRFVSPEDAKVSTSDYGTLVFDNPSRSLLLVPCHAGYVVKQAAQDHAMSHMGLVKSRGSRSYNTAMCVQQSQGGLISGERQEHRRHRACFTVEAFDVLRAIFRAELGNLQRHFTIKLCIQC